MGARKPAKYFNKKVHWEGMTFDSIREFERFQELRIMEKAGEISDLKIQPKFPLKIGDKDIRIRSDRYPNGRRVSYYGDFAYTDSNGETVVEDVKGQDTPVSRLKRAIVESQYGVAVKIVR